MQRPTAILLTHPKLRSPTSFTTVSDHFIAQEGKQLLDYILYFIPEYTTQHHLHVQMCIQIYNYI